MTVAMSRAVADGNRRLRLRLDRQHRRSSLGLRGPRRYKVLRHGARREDRPWQSRPSPRPRRRNSPDRRQLRRRPKTFSKGRFGVGRGSPRKLRKPGPHRRPEDSAFEVCEVLDKPRMRWPCRRQRRKHHRLLEGLYRMARRSFADTAPGCSASRRGSAPAGNGPRLREPRDGGERNPHRAPASKQGALNGHERIRRPHRKRSLTRRSWTPSRLLAGEEGVFCEPASAAGIAGLLKLVPRGSGSRGNRRQRAYGARPQRPGRYLESGSTSRSGTGDVRGGFGQDGVGEAVISVRVPATSANLGPGYDAVGTSVNTLHADKPRPGPRPARRGHTEPVQT